MQETEQVIKEKNIKDNTVIKEGKNNKVEDRMLKLKESLKDLESAYSSGLIPESVYSKSKAKIEEEMKVIEGEKSKAEREVKEEKQESKEKVIEEEAKQKEVQEEEKEKVEVKEGGKDVREELKDNAGKGEAGGKKGGRGEKEKVSVESRHVKEYKELKENWIKDLESLRNLYEHGVIEEEEYEKSKADIEEKIGKMEVLIKRELEKEELEELKERIEKEIKDALSRGIFKEEEEKYKKDLEALENLYRRGLISKEEFDKKKKEIEKEIGNYKRLIELVDAIFEKYINELSTKVESMERETQQKEVQEEEESKEEEEEKEELSWWDKLLIKLHIKKEAKKEEGDSLEKRIKEIYKKGEQRFKISDMAMEIKKEVKKMLNIEEALTYAELREKLKEDKTLDPALKSKLIDYFNDIEIKEYLSEGEEKDVDAVYKATINIAQEIERFKKKGGKGGRKVKDKGKLKDIEKEEGKEINKEEKGKEGEKGEEKSEEENKESKPREEDTKNKDKEKEGEEHKSIFDKINEFFGV